MKKILLLIIGILVISTNVMSAVSSFGISTNGIKHGHGSEDQTYHVTIILKNGAECTVGRFGTKKNWMFDKKWCSSKFLYTLTSFDMVDKIVFASSSNAVFIAQGHMMIGRRGKYLPHNRWVGPKVDNLQRKHTLYLKNDPRITNYTIRIDTSIRKKAGTDANIKLDIFGEGSETDLYKYQPDSPADNFEKGAHELFELYIPSLGKLRAICISSDGAGDGSGWYPEQIVITNNKTNKKTTVPLNFWLDNDRRCFNIF